MANNVPPSNAISRPREKGLQSVTVIVGVLRVTEESFGMELIRVRKQLRVSVH